MILSDVYNINEGLQADYLYVSHIFQSGAKSMRKISDMPKIIKGTDIPQFRGNFVLMRAKLENLQHGGKRSKQIVLFFIFLSARVILTLLILCFQIHIHEYINISPISDLLNLSGPSKGRVVCGDGASVHFSCVPFLLRNNPVKLGDQVL